MNRATNKFHCDLKHPTKKELDQIKNEEVLFDKLGTGMQIAFLVGIILTVPIWFTFWVADEIIQSIKGK